VASALTNVPSGLTNVVRTTLLGTNAIGFGWPGDQDIRRWPYIVAETGDGRVAIWGGRRQDEGNDPYFGYLTNFISPVLSGVTKLTIHNYTNISGFYPIVVAERGTNQPYVCANNALSNVPTQATNLTRLTLTGRTNTASGPRYLVGETSDQRVVIWGNEISTNSSFLWQHGHTTNVNRFKLVRADADNPTAVALLNDKTMRVWGGAYSQPEATNSIPTNLTNVRSFMVLDRNFTAEGDSSPGTILIIANEEGGKIQTWWSDGQNSSDSQWNGFKSALAGLTDVRLIPYDQESLSSRTGSFHRGGGAGPAVGLDWPVLFLPSNENSAQIRVVGRNLAPSAAPFTFTSIPTTPEAFSASNIHNAIPLGSETTAASSSWVIALKMADGTSRLQTVSSTGSFSSTGVWNRTASYFSSPNATTPLVFPGKQLGFASQNTAPASINTDDNLVIVAEPYQITP
jgi:hypothetical protein